MICQQFNWLKFLENSIHMASLRQTITLLEGVVDHIDYRDDILQNADKFLGNLARNPTTSQAVDAICWAHETTMRTYADLVQVKTGLWFSAKHTFGSFFMFL
jgi:hypothetical protein